MIGQNVRLLSSDVKQHVFQKIEMDKRDGKVTADDFNKKVCCFGCLEIEI
jgi:hypothetical protein